LRGLLLRDGRGGRRRQGRGRGGEGRGRRRREGRGFSGNVAEEAFCTKSASVSRSLEVIGSDTDRSAAYDFLITNVP